LRLLQLLVKQAGVGRVAEGTELMEAAAAGLAAVVGPDFPEVTRLREAIDEARAQ
jgi:hypothetical protein